MRFELFDRPTSRGAATVVLHAAPRRAALRCTALRYKKRYRFGCRVPENVGILPPTVGTLIMKKWTFPHEILTPKESLILWKMSPSTRFHYQIYHEIWYTSFMENAPSKINYAIHYENRIQSLWESRRTPQNNCFAKQLNWDPKDNVFRNNME